MPSTKTITTYTFDELSDAAKDNARAWFRDGHLEDNFWSEATVEEFVREAEHMGIEIKTRPVRLMGGGTRQAPCIFWSGFSSQGDGACFEGTWSARDVKAEKVADGWGDSPATKEIKRIASCFAEVAKDFPEAWFKVEHRGQYSHEYCTVFDVSLGEDFDNLEHGFTQEQWSAVEKELIETARDYMKWLYLQLEKEYEYRMSDEAVDEDIRANDYEFTEDGERSVVL